MKIKYKTIDRKEVAKKSIISDARYRYEYKVEVVEFCCEKMEEAYEKKFIVFGEPDTSLNVDNKTNIVSRDAYLEGIFYDIMAINFCPWCKKKIETVEIKRVILALMTKKVEKTEYVEMVERQFQGSTP